MMPPFFQIWVVVGGGPLWPPLFGNQAGVATEGHPYNGPGLAFDFGDGPGGFGADAGLMIVQGLPERG